MTKLIYFPLGHEAGMKRGFPVVVHLLKTFPDGTFLGCPDGPVYAEDLQDGRGLNLRLARTVAFSEAAWACCVAHVARRHAVESEYEKLPGVCKKATAQPQMRLEL